MLAEYAVRNSRGRRYPEPSHSYRSDFQRDRDRIIHSRAFRRLEAKTQVFTRRYSDHFRNRLTHTIEVAQIARTIATQLNLNVDLVEALALVHDVGHPPFGHAGEQALDRAMRDYSSAFDHNLHALRIVEDFELRYPSFRGLNLTFETREGIIKHSRDYKAEDYPQLSEYCLDLRPPLEAQLIDLADEIAYNTADLDDGYEAHLLSLEQIADGIPVFADFYRAVEETYPAAPEKLKFNEALRNLLDRFVTDFIANTQHEILEAQIAGLEDVRTLANRLTTLSPAVEQERDSVKQFLHKNLYFSETLDPDKTDAERVIGELFKFWMEHPESLPQGYQAKAADEPLSRVVCDYIAGMTDNYIQQQHSKHCGGIKTYALRAPS
jgi:dGTPase